MWQSNCPNLTKTVFSPSNKWKHFDADSKDPANRYETKSFSSCDLCAVESLDNDVPSIHRSLKVNLNQAQTKGNQCWGWNQLMGRIHKCTCQIQWQPWSRWMKSQQWLRERHIVCNPVGPKPSSHYPSQNHRRLAELVQSSSTSQRKPSWGQSSLSEMQLCDAMLRKFHIILG